MKTKRTNRLIALALVVVMLVPMISIPVTAWDIPSGATQFLTEDFDDIAQKGDSIAVSNDDVKTNILGAHPYSKLVEKSAENAADKFLLVPFKGIGNGSRNKLDQDDNIVWENAKDSYGNVIYEYVYEQDVNEDGTPKVDSEGNPVYKQQTNEDGTPKFDSEGKPVYVRKRQQVQEPLMVPAYEQDVNEDGTPKVDENYKPVYKQEVNEDGTPKVDENGNPVYVIKRNEDGTIVYVQAKDENGNPLTKGKVEIVYDEQGNPKRDPVTNEIMTEPVYEDVLVPKKVPARENYTDGNVDKSAKLNNMSVSPTDQGIIIEMDVLLHYVDLKEENCGYEYDGAYEAPSVEFQIATVTHDKIGTNTTSTNNISLAKINLKSGDVANVGNKVPGVNALKQDTWYTFKFVIDLVLGTYETYINGEQYALFGYISTGNTSAGLSNIGFASGQLVVAKCLNATGSYNNSNVAYEEMTYVGLDNVAMYTDVNYVVKEEIYEPEILNKISGETFNTRHVGTSPMSFGYKSAPATARIVADPTDTSGDDRCVRVDFRGYRATNPDGYCVWATDNSQIKDIKNVSIDENGILTGKSDWGNVSGAIWGDDEIERKYKPTANIPNPLYGSDHPDEPEFLEQYKINPATVSAAPTGKVCYIVTSEFADAMCGGSNVAASFAPRNPLMNANNYGTIALQVKYYLSADAVGEIEMQMNSSNSENGSNGWIDTIRVNAYANGTATVSHGPNYVVIAGSPVYVNREEWFTINVVFDLATQCEDIFFNGDYLYTLAPKNGKIENASVRADTWSIGKPIRNKLPDTLAGYYLVDDVMIFNDKGIVDDIYNRSYVENFDEITEETDLTTTGFANNLPSSVQLYADPDNGHDTALKMDMSLDVDLNGPKMFWSKLDPSLGTYEEGQYKVVRKRLTLNGKSFTQAGFDTAEKIEPGVDGGFGKWKLTKGGQDYIFEETSYAEYATYYCLGNNANKDWTFANPGLGQATNELIAADFELFISEDAGGKLLGKILNYTDGVEELQDLPLYTIDTATGNIGFGTDTNAATLEKGVWNTVSFVINMKTGAVSLFINNVWVVDGDLGYQHFSFMTDNWVVARIDAAPGTADALNGYILLDDVRMFSVTDEIIEINKDREGFISATFKGEAVEEGDKFFITDDVTDFVEEKFNPEEYEDLLDASNMKDYELNFRHVNPTGLRFTVEVDEDLLDELKETYGEDAVKVGMVILPADTVAGWETITVAQLEAENKVYRNFIIDEFYDDNIIAASIANIKEQNMRRDFRAMAYVEVTVSEMGNTATICSELMTANIAKLAHDYLDENDDLEGAIGKWVEYYDSFYKG